MACDVMQAGGVRTTPFEAHASRRRAYGTFEAPGGHASGGWACRGHRGHTDDGGSRARGHWRSHGALVLVLVMVLRVLGLLAALRSLHTILRQGHAQPLALPVLLVMLVVLVAVLALPLHHTLLHSLAPSLLQGAAHWGMGLLRHPGGFHGCGHQDDEGGCVGVAGGGGATLAWPRGTHRLLAAAVTDTGQPKVGLGVWVQLAGQLHVRKTK